MKKLCFAAIFLVVCGCSIFNGREQALRVKSTPGDATVFVDGTPYPCPLEMNVPRNRDLHIRVIRDGYFPFETTSRRTLSGYGITDAVSAVFLLFPALGLTAPGAWELTQTDFNVLLVQIPQNKE